MAMRESITGKGGTTMVKPTHCWIGCNLDAVPACPREELVRRA